MARAVSPGGPGVSQAERLAMRFSDTASGAVATIAGLAVAACARTFPPMPGQGVGPGMFPFVVGLGLAALGLALLVSGVRARQPPRIEIDGWMRRPRMVLTGALVPAALIGYALVVDRLGFLLTATLFLGALLAAFGVRRAWILPIAVVVSLALHTVFYGLLRVPLPWGVLEGVAW